MPSSNRRLPRSGRWHGTLHQLHSPEGQRQQEPLRSRRDRQVARGLLGCAGHGNRARTAPAHGKQPLKTKPREPEVKETKVSRTDPESGYMVRDGKPKGFFYLDHRTVDGRLGIITDTMRRLQTCTIRSSISDASIASANASALMSEPSAWMPVMRPAASPRDLRIAAFSASSAIAVQPRRGPA